MHRKIGAFFVRFVVFTSTRVYSVIWIQSPVSTKPNMLDNIGPSTIWKFICGNFWDIFTTAFDLLRYASNNGIISLYRYGINCNCKYFPAYYLVILSLSLYHEFGQYFEQVLFPFEIFHLDRTLPHVPCNFSLSFLCHFLFLYLMHTPLVMTLR